MRVTVFRGETSVGEIADKAYGGLSTASRKKAAAALIKANPRLERLEKLEPGTLLTIPEVPGVRVAARHGEHPVDVLADVITRSLEAYRARLEERHDQFAGEQERQASLLKGSVLRVAPEASPEFKRLSSEAAVSIPRKQKAATEARKRLVAAVEKLTTELAKR